MRPNASRLARWLSALFALTVLLRLPGRQAAAERDLGWVLQLGDRAKAKLPSRTKREAVHRYGLKAVALRRSFVKQHDTRYKVQVPGSSRCKVRDQQYSGRCWIFASGRVLRSKTRKTVNPAPKLSTSFVTYHALRQVSHALIREAARTDGPPDFSCVGEAEEGGFQIWAMDIIRRHGFVPAEKMPFTADGADPGVFLTHLQTMVAAAMRDFARVDGRDKKQRRQLLRDYRHKIDDLLATTIGKPPRRFRYDGQRYSPQKFRSDYLKLQDEDLQYVTLTHYPNRGWYSCYEGGDSPGFKPFVEYNVPMLVIQRAIKKTLRRGEAVLFGMNVSEDHPYRANSDNHPDKDRAKGILSVSAFRYKDFIPGMKLSKRDQINAGISAANHAMVITAYDPGKRRGTVRKWRVENSHGASVGDNGYFHAYDDYVRRYMEDVVVPRAALPKRLLDKLEASTPLVRPEDRYQRGRRATDLQTAIKTLRRMF